MAQFLRTFLASCLGASLGLLLLIFIGAAILGSLASQVEKKSSIDPNSVLRLTFADVVPELTDNVESQDFSRLTNSEKTLGLHDMAGAIVRAADDDNIKGILIEPEDLMVGGFASARTLRQALQKFKAKGKFIYAFSKYYTQGSYYLASVADQVYLDPLGFMEVKGFAVQAPFYKSALDRWGVNMQIFYAGKFKGATEPYRLDKFSPENRLQYQAFLQDFYGIWLQEVAQSRGLNRSKLKTIVDQYQADSPDQAKALGLVDATDYRQELLSRIRKKLGLKDSEKISFTTIQDVYRAHPTRPNLKERNKIAVIYAEGTIIDGKGENGYISDQRYVKAIETATADERVKALVLRVNSGGGSALASESIWYALEKAKAKGKKLVVSMGDYAASGGYYIACGADSIFAEPNTVTGSIGVFSIIPSLEKTLREEVGVNFDSVKTGPFATGLNPFFNLSPAEGAKMQRSTERMYEIFLKRVATGRNMSRDQVHEIAQGRVWSGQDAIEIGLVDRLGNLEQALKAAAKLAGIKTYRVSNYPQLKDPFQQILETFMGQEEETAFNSKTGRLIQREFPSWWPAYRWLYELQHAKGPQMRLMVEIPFQ